MVDFHGDNMNQDVQLVCSYYHLIFSTPFGFRRSAKFPTMASAVYEHLLDVLGLPNHRYVYIDHDRSHKYLPKLCASYHVTQEPSVLVGLFLT